MRLCILSSRQFEQTLKDSQWRKAKQMQPKPLCMSMCLLQILPVSVCFLANITFVLLQIFFMAFDHMCLQIVRSTKILGTYLTCNHTVCMNLKMPCEVPFLEHFSTFVTFDLLMPLAVLVQFGFGHKRFSTPTCMVKHGLDQ